MAKELNKELAQELMGIKGEVAGGPLKTDMEFVLTKMGKEGLARLEKELNDLGFPTKYKEINNVDFYPAGLRVLSLLAIKKVFGFDDEEIKEMGFIATKKSLIIKLFVRYFLSTERVFYKEAPRIWQKHWTKGTLVPIELNEKEKYAVLRLEDFELHPIYCSVYLRGYFSGILQMLIKTPKITCQETKCSFKGDQYHEYLLKWQ